MANSIYSRDNVILTYWYTALGLWCTAGIIWLNKRILFFDTNNAQPVVVLWISALLLGLGVWDRYLSFPPRTCCRNVDIYCHHYAYRRVISLPFSQVARPFSRLLESCLV